ncbi:MAG: VWA domain-containing protein [Gemmataceae bacterium]|nr:VWA domain-containing protein [Gemmataceae bacterium]
MKRFTLTALALALGLLLTAGSRTTAQAPKVAEGAKNIDLVICLDVSGSMQGLINSARARLWDIVNELAKIKPAPNLRVALFSYGSASYPREAGWIKKDLDLTTDLDALYEKLFALKIGGSVEYATRVCRDAVEQLKWSEDRTALKIIFVCGNEPASQDKLVSLKEAANRAKAKAIIINPIYCGNPQHRDAADWIEFASLSGGRFASIDQDRGTVAIAAPQDKQIVELGNKMNATYLAYGKSGGDKARNQLAQDRNAYQAGAGVAAARVASKNTALYRCEDWDLVDRMKQDPKFDLTKLAEAELPEAMRKLTPAQRVAYVKDATARREALQKQITQLTRARDTYVREQMKGQQGSAGRAFDAALRETLRIQARERGITIPE